jgi:hypothetical protein
VKGRGDLDEDALVALAGPGGPAMAKKLRKEIERKFGAGFAPRLLAAAEAAPGELVAYSCFRKSLPYELAFERLGPYLPFRGAQVEVFRRLLHRLRHIADFIGKPAKSERQRSNRFYFFHRYFEFQLDGFQ